MCFPMVRGRRDSPPEYERRRRGPIPTEAVFIRADFIDSIRYNYTAVVR